MTMRRRWILLLLAASPFVLGLFLWRTYQRIIRTIIEAEQVEISYHYVGWGMLVYADEHGRFPTSPDELMKAKPRNELSDRSTEWRPWPQDCLDARIRIESEQEWYEHLAAALNDVQVEWAEVPLVSTRKAQVSGTREGINGWLQTYAEHHPFRVNKSSRQGDGND